MESEKLMKNFVTQDHDASMKKIKPNDLNFSYKVTDHSIELEVLEEDESSTEQYAFNLYMWIKSKEIIEIRTCLNDRLDFLDQLKPNTLPRYFEIYPQLYQKLDKNRRFGDYGDGVLRRVRDPDDRTKKWFLVYRFECVSKPFDLNGIEKFILDPEIQELIETVLEDTIKFLQDLDPSRISPLHQIKRGVMKGLNKVVGLWARELIVDTIAEVLTSDTDGDISGLQLDRVSSYDYLKQTREVPEIFKPFVERN